MTELFQSCQKISKVRDEIEDIIKEKEKGEVEESDIGRLLYLQAVMKETLRLHMPTPFLVPQKAEVDVQIIGYMVPKSVDILMNV